MGEEYPARSFKSGNSVAIRIPAALGVEPDRDWKIERVDGELHVREANPPAKKIDLSAVYGRGAGLKSLLPEDRVFEKRNLDLTGEKLKPRD